ncbi:nascent polypeptide-associated complex subunit alpha [Drosophila rhopaloa]|uniref:Nascent polypeptide-associated complex subunit alpha n=1 Tax=Drosophila rhopaloa TaxID=1041015 RepID=A0A6P4DUT4_DRORH|nr:nascent polypeptide-associated complex subunit alpha [Drosophila rhopaloa]
MGKKQKMKMAAQMAIAASASAAKKQEEIKAMDHVLAAKGAGAKEAPAAGGGRPGCSARKEPNKMDPKYRKNLKKLMSLAQKLPANLLTPKKSQEAAATAEDSNGSGESTDSDDEEAPNLVELSLKDKLGELSSLGQLALRSTDSAKQSRGEKKARRILMKLDLKPIENVVRVTMKKNKNILLCINKPEVYKVPHSETIICFGEIRVEDLTNAAASQAVAKAAERYCKPTPGTGEDAKNKEAATAEAPAVDDGDEEEVDVEAAKALDEKDIELVQMQAVCTRNRAIKALLKNDNDVVNAIMALTVG